MISCLMVTLPTLPRMAGIRRSIADYCRQTHADRELVVVIDHAAGDAAGPLLAHVAGLNRADIRVTLAPDRRSLGALRNLAMAIAQGDVICQWDDDDRAHPCRIERQYARLADADAAYLQDVIQYFPQDQALYWTRWRATPAAGHPGTLMARRTAALRYPEHGETARRGEDLVVARALIAGGRVAYLADEPWLHVYVSHGRNTWDEGHHRMLARELAVSQALLMRGQDRLRTGLAPFGFAGAGIDVVGRNGIAFRL